MSAKTVAELSPQTGSSSEQFPGAPCPFCQQPGVYIRTRHFGRGQIAHVWTCKQPSCAQFHLYWHTDTLASLPPVHPKCRVFGFGAVLAFLAQMHQQKQTEVTK